MSTVERVKKNDKREQSLHVIPDWAIRHNSLCSLMLDNHKMQPKMQHEMAYLASLYDLVN